MIAATVRCVAAGPPPAPAPSCAPHRSPYPPYTLQPHPLLPPRPSRHNRSPRAVDAGRRFPAIFAGFSRRPHHHRPPLVRLGDPPA
eukprot:5201068-Prymnesium_polylepis.1